ARRDAADGDLGAAGVDRRVGVAGHRAGDVRPVRRGVWSGQRRVVAGGWLIVRITSTEIRSRNEHLVVREAGIALGEPARWAGIPGVVETRVAGVFAAGVTGDVDAAVDDGHLDAFAGVAL